MARITHEMSTVDIILDLSENDSGTMVFLLNLLSKSSENVEIIFYFDELGIYGNKIYKLFAECCDRNWTKFFNTIQAFKDEMFTTQEILANLNLGKSHSFLD